MSFLVTKTYGHDLGLSAAFRQPRAKSHCRFIHGYALSFRLVFEAHTLNSDNWVLDFGGLKPVKQFLCDHFDHKLVVAEDDPCKDEICALAGLDCVDPLVLPSVGCEAFARFVFDHVSDWLAETHPEDMLSRGLHLVEVEVREHGANSALYRGGAA